MKKLTEIAALYTQEGYSQMPAAIIRHGSWPDQRVAVGVAGALPELAATHGLSHPAIILIGEVVGLDAAATQKNHRPIPLYAESPAAII